MMMTKCVNQYDKIQDMFTNSFVDGDGEMFYSSDVAVSKI